MGPHSVLVCAAVAAAVAAAAGAAGADPPAREWWQTALVYQIYPRSFKDSNGDGIGDLNGITEKLPYLAETGVEVLWMSPIFLSPMYDFGYDIADYRQIAPEYGTMADFERLLAESKKLGLRVVLDFVPNHTSNESEWFVRSARREPGYEDYYVRADGRPDPAGPSRPGAAGTLPPNNWVSIFRKSAWEWHPVRQQYYLHQFVIGQPDLNYREPRVVEEMKNVLRFWLDKGVSGFRVDAVNVLFEADPEDFGGVYPDEPLSGQPGATPDDPGYLQHVYTQDQEPTYDMVYQWRDVLDEYIQKDGEHKIMLTEAYTDIHLVMRYYGSGARDGSIPFNFDFLRNINNESSARDIKFTIDKWLTYMPSGKSANWVNGNHDNSRMASRDGPARADGMNMLALLLPDVTLTYQGEELAMTDGFVSWEETVDPQACNTDDPVDYYKSSRDPARTPFHWDGSRHAGFSNATGATWLPVAADYREVNLAAQQAAANSHYKFYKRVAALRRSAPVRRGDTDVKALSDDVLVVARSLPGHRAVVALVNLAGGERAADLTPLRSVPRDLTVAAAGVDCTLQPGASVQKSSVVLSAHAAVVLLSVQNVPDKRALALHD